MKTNNGNVELVLRVRKVELRYDGKEFLKKTIAINCKHIKLPSLLYNYEEVNNYVGVVNSNLQCVEIYLNSVNCEQVYDYIINRHEYAFEGTFEYDFNVVKARLDLNPNKPYQNDVTHAIVAWFEVMEAEK